ncbi:hypothetical protein [Streptomyces sp. CA-111067]|uniref:hypothetical protein n=1 Tax=Streptomyces sp. CA-111067 TaxID=3240046 RepID=UPI003D9842A3
MRARTLVSVAVTACVALAVGACGPEKSKEDTGAKPAQSSASTLTTHEPSATASASARTATPSAEPTAGAGPAPKTKAGAIQRYEVFLHAVGHEDINTVCDVAGPAAKQAEDQGLGPCTSTLPVTFKLISPAQKKALQTATVDPQRVVMRSSDKAEIPAGAIMASMTFSGDELGDSTLEYLKGDWYITG